MSGSQYAQTQDEMAGILGMSRQQFGKYASQPDAPRKVKSGYNIQQWSSFVREVKDRGLSGDGSLKDEKTLREIKRLDIIIAKEVGELVDRRETEKEYRKHLSSIKQVITDWQAHETAKHPIHVDLIDNLAKRLIDRIAESCGE